MKTLVYGAGAIGGYLGAILSAAGEDVKLVARGAQFEALNTRGITLEGPRSGRTQPIKVRAVRPGEERGPYDLIFVTLKAHQLGSAAEHIRALGGKDAIFVFPQNGLPWWYFDGVESRYRGTKLKSVDPDGTLSRTFDAANIVGGIAFKPSDLIEPGRIRLADTDADALTLGEIDNTMSERVQSIAKMVDNAGWAGKPVSDIRKGKWMKLLSNAVWNTMGAITQSTAKEAASFPASGALGAQMIRELIAVAEALDYALDVNPEIMVAETAKRVNLPTSTLQDVRAGRSLELDALINVVVELGKLTDVATPALAIIATCANLLNERIVADGISIKPIKTNS
jgi:2-dehydropantoate 2-reductase